MLYEREQLRVRVLRAHFRALQNTHTFRAHKCHAQHSSKELLQQSRALPHNTEQTPEHPFQQQQQEQLHQQQHYRHDDSRNVYGVADDRLNDRLLMLPLLLLRLCVASRRPFAELGDNKTSRHFTDTNNSNSNDAAHFSVCGFFCRLQKQCVVGLDDYRSSCVRKASKRTRVSIAFWMCLIPYMSVCVFVCVLSVCLSRRCARARARARLMLLLTV